MLSLDKAWLKPVMSLLSLIIEKLLSTFILIMLKILQKQSRGAMIMLSVFMLIPSVLQSWGIRQAHSMR